MGLFSKEGSNPYFFVGYLDQWYASCLSLYTINQRIALVISNSVNALECLKIKFKFVLMNYRILLMFLLTGLFASFSIPKKVHKKIDKQIQITFEVESFDKVGVSVPDDIQKELLTPLNPDNFFSIISDGNKIGYFYFGHGFGKTDQFDFVVLLNLDLVITKTKVLVYREDHGSEIGSKRWLRQFSGKKGGDKMRYQHDIAAISGATLSAESMTDSINKFLASLAILHKKNFL